MLAVGTPEKHPPTPPKPQLAPALDSKLVTRSSIKTIRSRVTEKQRDLMLKKDYSQIVERGGGGIWGPLTPAVRQQQGYKVSTLEVSVNVKTFCLRYMTPYAAATTLFGTIASANDGH